MRKFSTYLFTTLLSIGLVASSNAAVMITAESIPTPDLAGFSTWTVTASSDVAAINGIDISFDGPLNQVNPFGLATIFQDNNGAVAGSGANVLQDSQFLFMSSAVLSLNTAESANQLRGAITNLAPLNVSNAIAFAQLVIPDGEMVSFSGAVEEQGNPTAVPILGMIGMGGTGGEGVVLSGGGDLHFIYTGEVQQISLSNTGDEPLSFDGPAFAFSGPDMANWSLLGTPDFSDIPAGGDRTFDLVFSTLGQFPPQRDYEATLEFFTTNDTGNQANVATFNLTATVPEPSTVMLAGLGLVGAVGLARRRK